MTHKTQPNNNGFTLIELMVVIVIIGVLSTLAIPRFVQVSDKAKLGEAPKIIANFESAYLATLVEYGDVKWVPDNPDETNFNLMYTIPSGSTLFEYGVIRPSENAGSGVIGLRATSINRIGKFPDNEVIGTDYLSDTHEFTRCVPTADPDAMLAISKFIPNFSHGNAPCSGTIVPAGP